MFIFMVIQNENDLKIFNNYLNPRDLNFDNLKSEKNILNNKNY